MLGDPGLVVCDGPQGVERVSVRGFRCPHCTGILAAGWRFHIYIVDCDTFNVFFIYYRRILLGPSTSREGPRPCLAAVQR